jgi:hypothetical protein
MAALGSGRTPPSERLLDAAIECTFPASDPIAVQQAFTAACEREDQPPRMPAKSPAAS